MGRMDSGQAWDKALESGLKNAMSRQSEGKPFGLAKLLPKRTDMAQVRQQIQRSIPEIDQSLRTVLRSLIAGESPWPFFLHGPPGVGKTCAALCLIDFAGGRYFTVPDLAQTVIDSQKGLIYDPVGSRIYPVRFWDSISKENLIVLDEIGCRSQVSDAHYEAVKRCIDERAGRPFVAISNMGLEAIGKLYDGRVFSRLSAGTVVELAGKDRRV